MKKNIDDLAVLTPVGVVADVLPKELKEVYVLITRKPNTGGIWESIIAEHSRGGISGNDIMQNVITMINVMLNRLSLDDPQDKTYAYQEDGYYILVYSLWWNDYQQKVDCMKLILKQIQKLKQ